MPLLYIDTNILIYAIEESVNKQGKNISNSSADLFTQAALATITSYSLLGH